MSWKSILRLSDLDPDMQIEVACHRCGHIRTVTARTWQQQPSARALYLDQIEQKARCRARGCKGAVRLSQVRKDTGGFVGGIA